MDAHTAAAACAADPPADLPRPPPPPPLPPPSPPPPPTYMALDNNALDLKDTLASLREGRSLPARWFLPLVRGLDGPAEQARSRARLYAVTDLGGALFTGGRSVRRLRVRRLNGTHPARQPWDVSDADLGTPQDMDPNDTRLLVRGLDGALEFLRVNAVRDRLAGLLASAGVTAPPPTLTAAPPPTLTAAPPPTLTAAPPPTLTAAPPPTLAHPAAAIPPPPPSSALVDSPLLLLGDDDRGDGSGNCNDDVSSDADSDPDYVDGTPPKRRRRGRAADRSASSSSPAAAGTSSSSAAAATTPHTVCRGLLTWSAVQSAHRTVGAKLGGTPLLGGVHIKGHTAWEHRYLWCPPAPALPRVLETAADAEVTSADDSDVAQHYGAAEAAAMGVMQRLRAELTARGLASSGATRRVVVGDSPSTSASPATTRPPILLAADLVWVGGPRAARKVATWVSFAGVKRGGFELRVHAWVEGVGGVRVRLAPHAGLGGVDADGVSWEGLDRLVDAAVAQRLRDGERVG